MKIIVLKRDWFFRLLGIRAITLWPLIFVRKEAAEDKILLNHEKIHIEQCKEMLVFFFYLWYIIEWLIRFLTLRDFWKAYFEVSFEGEAYSNQDNLLYLQKRKSFSWTEFL